jgi:membrane fusion protein (multidrug efflux system)
MFKRKRNIVIISVAVIALLLIALRLKNTDDAKRIMPKPTVVPGKVGKGEIQRSETLTGDILPIQQANIYPKVNGNIEKIYVDIGSYVKSGQVLALIDTTIYSQNAKQAYANYRQASANFENNKTNYERNKTLMQQNFISKQDLDNSRTTMEVASSQKEAAHAAYLNALTQLGYCKITAPFSGYITKRNLDPGAYVTSSGGGQSSTIFVLLNVDELKSIVNIPEKDVPLLNKVQAIEVRADALPDTVFNAKLKKISEAVDLNTRTMAIEIDIENPASHRSGPVKMLKPGMFASITLIFDKKPNSLILPDQVVLSDEKGNYIYVLNQDSSVSKKYIKLGIRQNNKNEVLSGIDENTNIVFVGQNLVKDKMKVKIIK